MSNSAIEPDNLLPNILPPIVTQMNRYGDYPVDLFNGLVNISIPLFEIQTRKLKLPLQLSFHASGLRSDEQEGLIGLRWLLNASGYTVNRKVKCYPDDGYSWRSFSFDNRVNNPDYIPDLATLYGTTASYGGSSKAIPQPELSYLTYYDGDESDYMDTEYDIFSYNLPSGKSGKFILKDSANIKTPCTLPYEPVKIEMKNNNSGSYNQVIITDENGICYNFGKTIHLPNPVDNTEWGGGFSYYSYRSVWYLNAIVSADKKDSILLEYTPIFVHKKYPYSEIKTLKENYFETFYGVYSFGFNKESFLEYFLQPYYEESDYIWHTESSSYNYSALSKIIFKGGRIELNYSNIFGSNYLSSMEIFNTNSIPVKTIEFSYKQENTLVLLEQLSFPDAVNLQNPQKEIYKFDYYNTNLYTNIPTAGRVAESDWWGYYLRGGNNLIADTITIDAGGIYDSYIKQEKHTIGDNYLYHKNASVADMKIGMIKSIEYPTGGKTIYDYESNFYINPYNAQLQTCGGLRIKTVENIPANGKSELKTYKYNPSNSSYSGAGEMPFFLYPPNSNGNNEKNFVSETTTIGLFGGEQGEGYFSAWCSRVEYLNHTYSNLVPDQFFDFSSNIVYYNKVIEYQGTEDSNSGYTEYNYQYTMPEYNEYNREEYLVYPKQNSYRQHIYVLPTKYGENSRLQKKVIFNENKQLTEETEYYYSLFDKGLLYDMPVKRYHHYRVEGSGNYVSYPENHKLRMADIFMNNAFGYVNQKYELGASRLTKETQKRYTPNGIVITIKDFEYDTEHLLLAVESITNSDSKITKIDYKYPFNFNYTPYTDMASKNIITTITEQSESNNNVFLQKTVIDYKNWGNNLFAPEYVKLQVGNNDEETRLIYHKYDTHGNPLYVSKDDATKVVYLWSYNGQYPIVKIENADYDAVKTALGNYTDEQINALSAQANPNVATISSTLRTQLPNALITTYKYRPLVGVTEITDPRGTVTYYDYDDFGRLKEAYYYEGNVVSAANKRKVEGYDYHYR